MAHIVLAWELGGGFGHLTRLKALARELLTDKHRVTLVARHLGSACTVFAPLAEKSSNLNFVQAPFYNGHLPNSLEQTPAYVHVLFNVGYGHPEILPRLVANWYRTLCELEPDMLIADHSPTALMTSRDMGIPRINFGDGFTCPPPSNPLPQLHSSFLQESTLADEAKVLKYCNQALAVQGISPMGELADIYRVNETFLTTLAELDHLGERAQVHYSGALWGEVKQSDTLQPVWPDVYGPKIFAYLKVQEHLQSQLEVLEQTGLPVLAYIPDVGSELIDTYANSPSVELLSQPVGTSKVLERAQLVVSHGGHQLAAECLLAGKPQVHLPLHLEQQLLALRCEQTGSSLSSHPAQFGVVFSQALENLSRLTDSARQLAATRHRQRNPLGRCMALIRYWLGGEC